MDKKNRKIIPFRQKLCDRRAMTVFGAVLAMLVLILAFFVVDGGRNWDSVRRFAAFGNESLRIDRVGSDHWAVLEGNLVTAGDDGIVLYEEDGSIAFVASAELSVPELQTGGERIMAYDAGGLELLLLDEKGTLLLHQTDQGSIYDADLSAGGAVACLTAGNREKTVLRVYDREQLVCYTVYSDTRYLCRCALSTDAEYVCAVALGEENGSFNATAVVYDTSREDPVAELSLGNQMIYDVKFWGENTICLLGENSAITMNVSGELLGTYEYRALLDYSLEGNGYCVLAAETDAGPVLVTLNKKCQPLGRLALNSTDVQVCAGGKYLAWLTDGTLYMGSSSLKNVHGQEAATLSAGLCIGEPGVCYVVDSRGATRYLP